MYIAKFICAEPYFFWIPFLSKLCQKFSGLELKWLFIKMLLLPFLCVLNLHMIFDIRHSNSVIISEFVM